ncbi:MAG: transketolase [Acidobacteria bacterium]|nr:transketolase [Acidobacteriota bacterium]
MNRTENMIELKRTANRIRQDVVRMIGEAGSGHPGGSLSAADIVTALYFNEMRHDPARPDWPDRDRFILSKGHAVPVLYSAFMEAGYLSRDLLPTLRKLGSPLQGHPDRRTVPALEASTGSLGNGLSIGLGYALAARLDNRDYRVYVMMGDGENQEGQVWEAAMWAGYQKIDNIVAIVDYNKQQLDNWVAKILDLEPLQAKWAAFNWHTIVIDGHDMSQILAALRQARETKGKPTCIIANTVKGKGVSFMENNVEFHGIAPTPEQVKQAISELEREAANLG